MVINLQEKNYNFPQTCHCFLLSHRLNDERATSENRFPNCQEYFTVADAMLQYYFKYNGFIVSWNQQV